jgi:phosphate transport system substrate-binding protein
MFRGFRLLAATAGFIVLVTGAAYAQDAVGAGAPFPRAVFTKWTEMAVAGAGVTVTYDPSGAGPAHSKLLAREIDFSVSGLPLPEEIKALGDLIQFPYLVGGVVCVVNVPGIESNQFRLNGAVLALIYTGQIKNWNDPLIAAINPGANLPDLGIRPLSQRDFFGPTYGFTQYIMNVNADWREKFGPFIKKRWAVGSTVDSGDAMRETIRVLPGSIGYMDYNTAITTKATTVLLLNPAGQYVAPTQAGFAAASANADWSGSKDLVVPLFSRPGEASWPMSQTSYVQMPRKPRDRARGEAVRKFFDFVFTSGGQAATETNFVPLPAAAQARVRSLLNELGS